MTNGQNRHAATPQNGCDCTCHNGGAYARCNRDGGCGHLHTGCQICSAPTGDTGRLCRTHTAFLSSDLADVPPLWDELDTTRTRQDKITIATGAKSGGERPLFWNDNAAQVAWELQATLNAWALDVSRLGEDERDRLADIGQRNVPEIALWLIRNIAALRMHTETSTAYEEITDAIRRCRQAIDRPANRTRFEVGPCPELIDGSMCSGEVWAFIPVSEDKVSYLRCLECGETWDTTQWLKVGRRILTRKSQLRSA